MADTDDNFLLWRSYWHLYWIWIRRSCLL